MFFSVSIVVIKLGSRHFRPMHQISRMQMYVNLRPNLANEGGWQYLMPAISDPGSSPIHLSGYIMVEEEEEDDEEAFNERMLALQQMVRVH